MITMLALMVLGQMGEPCYRVPRAGHSCGYRAGGRTDPGFAWFEALPENYSGIPSVQNLCDQLTDVEKVGNWFCLKEDGTMATGSAITLVAAGSPATVSVPVCPNGPDCAAVTAQQLNGTSQAFAAASGNLIDNDFTVCALFRADTIATQLLANKTGFGGNAVVQMYMGSGGAAHFDVYKSGGSTPISTGAMSSGPHHLVCGTYDYVADGTSIQRVSLDGTAAGVTNAVGPPLASSQPWAVGYSQFVNGQYLRGLVRGAFYVPSKLTDARVAAIARSVLADAPTAARGEALTFARAGLKWCWNSTTGYGSWIPGGRACIGNDGALLVEKLGLNLAVQYEAIDNAAYTKEGSAGKVAVVTANDAGTQWGTVTGDAVHLFSTSGVEFSDVYQAITATGAVPFNVNARVAGARPADGGVAASGTTDICAYDGAAWSCTDCAYPAWPAYATCKHVDATPTGVNRYFKLGNNSNQNGGVARTEQDIILTGVQLEEQAYPTSLMPSGAAQAARIADAPSWAAGTGTVGCESAQVMTPGFQLTTLQQRVLGVNWDATNFYDHYINTGGTSVQHFTYIAAATRQHSGLPAISANTWNSITFRQNGVAGTFTTTINGTTTTSTPGVYSLPASAAVTLYPGKYGGASTYELNGWIRRIQLDPIYSRCRP